MTDELAFRAGSVPTSVIMEGVHYNARHYNLAPHDWSDLESGNINMQVVHIGG
jgi:hypothetical protein